MVLTAELNGFWISVVTDLPLFGVVNCSTSLCHCLSQIVVHFTCQYVVKVIPLQFFLSKYFLLRLRHARCLPSHVIIL